MIPQSAKIPRGKRAAKRHAVEACKRDFEAGLSTLICDTMNAWQTEELSLARIAFIIEDRLENAKRCL